MKWKLTQIVVQLFTGPSTMIEWKERGHEDVNVISMRHQPTLDALQECGILKKFQSEKMLKRGDLLYFLVEYWDSDG